jgi:hypothetical protein
VLQQAALVALRIALFRAGPQDFPHAPALTQVIVPLAAVAAFLQFRLTLPTAQAGLQALAWVGAIAGFTWSLLQARGLGNRLRQTLDSLLLIAAAMTLLMLAPLMALAPQVLRIAADPKLAETELLPALPLLTVVVVSFWNFLVTAQIYRHALDARPAVGVLVAALAGLVTVSFSRALAAVAG